MAEYRYRAITPDGRRIEGFIKADKKKEANQAVQVLARRKNLSIKDIAKRETFIYKAKGKYGETVKGEQKAYSKSELREALENLDYSDINIQKKLFASLGGVDDDEIARFMSMCSDLLAENLSFSEILNLQATDTQNTRLKGVIREVQRDLKDGKEPEETFNKHSDVFGDFPAFMMGKAVSSGNMQEIFSTTAKFLKRQQDFKKKMRQILLMPSFTMLVVIAGIIYYIMAVIPGMMTMFRQLDKDIPPITATTQSFMNFMNGNWQWITAVILLPIIAGFIYKQTEDGKVFFDKIKLKMPVIGRIFHNNAIEIFSRVFYSLYSGAGENVKAIRIAAEASNNKYIEKRVKDEAIPAMLKEGKSLVRALAQTEVFPRVALARFRSGEESGSLRTNARQLADYYEAQIKYSLERLVDSVNIFTAIIITIAMLYLILLASESVVIPSAVSM